MKRPLATDPYIRRVMLLMVNGPKALVKLIAYSHEVKDLYVVNRKNFLAFGSIPDSVRDMAFAKQRFSSMAQVFLRLTLTIRSAIATASQLVVLRGRGSKEGKACNLLMQSLDMDIWF